LSAGRLTWSIRETLSLPEGREKLPPPDGGERPVDLPEIDEPPLVEGLETLDVIFEGLETEWPEAL
jgi:hypothetical protein